MWQKRRREKNGRDGMGPEGKVNGEVGDKKMKYNIGGNKEKTKVQGGEENGTGRITIKRRIEEKRKIDS